MAAVLVTSSVKVYSGVCIDTQCSLGFCAEHAAIAEMLKNRESRIAMVVAVDKTGAILPPCGRCRELMWQVDPTNASRDVVIGKDAVVKLSQLLPFR